MKKDVSMFWWLRYQFRETDNNKQQAHFDSCSFLTANTDVLHVESNQKIMCESAFVWSKRRFMSTVS